MNTCFHWLFTTLILVVAVGCRKTSPDWNGTWKLNESKSSIPGPSFSITILPTGEYHLDNGTNSYDFRCDGREYTTATNRTLSCLQTSASVIDTTSKENGAKVGTAHWSLSPDERTLAIKATSFQTNGSAKSRENVYTRTSASAGFAGGWRDTKRLESRPELLLLLNDQRLHIAFPDSGQFTDPPLDGSEAAMYGPGVSEGMTMAIRPHGPQEFFTSRKLRGQIISEGSLRISADGHTLVEEYWRPDRFDEKAVLVYERQ
jgi:hypothetical protein